MSFYRQFLDDRDHRVNPASALAALLILASIVWVTALVFHNWALPDLTGIAYLLAGSGAMNIGNKMEGIVGQFRDPNSTTTTNTTTTTVVPPGPPGIVMIPAPPAMMPPA
jgi:hypothetical protein